MAATAAAAGQKEDPIEEDESDIVSARINIKKPWIRTSSPPRRLQTSMSLQRSTASQDNSLPPHLRASGSHTVKGQPITLHRLVHDSPPNDRSHGPLKLNSSARFGAFKPLNNLARGGLNQSYSTRAKGLSGLSFTSDGSRKKRRKLKESTIASDGEDELAGPGVDRNQDASPKKKKSLIAALPDVIDNHGHSEQNSLSATGLDHIPAGHAIGIGNVSLVETPKQRRDRGRHQKLLRRQRQRPSDTTSPYFGEDLGNKHDQQASSNPNSDKVLASYLEDSSLIGKEPHEDLQALPSSIGEDRGTRDTQASTSIAQEILKRHQKSWIIESFQDDKVLYEQGMVELVADKKTKVLNIRVNGQLKSCLYRMDTIFDVKFSESIIRLHFRGTGRQIAWIVAKGNAEFIVERLQNIQRFQAKLEGRTEQMLAKWNAENRRQVGTSPSTISSNQRTVTQLSPISKQLASNHKRLVTSPGEFSEQEQAGNAPETKKQKLNARLVSGTAHDDLIEPFATSGKNNFSASVLPADTSNSGLRGPLPSRNGSEISDFDNKITDILEPAGNTATIEAASIVSASSMAATDPTVTRPAKGLHQTEESDELIRSPEIHLPTRPTRSTRAQHRRRVGLEQYEPIPVVKYSKTRGLGPRWTEPLLWPRNGRKRVTVEFDDLERLDEEEFLNDNLVEFALRWMRYQNNDPPNIYWFNTYFFERLSKGKGKQIDYDGVKRWTKDVDLFSYDCVVVPINENYHWYLAIIYNLPQLKGKLDTTRPTDNPDTAEEVKKIGDGSDDSSALELLTQSIRLTSPRTPPANRSTFGGYAGLDGSLLTDEVDLKTKSIGRAKGRARDRSSPTIVTLDSLGIPHSQAVTALKSYLRAEARERLGLILEKDDIFGMTAKGIPSQNNLSDCGVYLLGYAAVMLQDSDEFKGKLLQKEFDQDTDWQYLQPKVLRSHLRRIIRSKHKHQTRRALNKNESEVSSGELSSEMSSDDTQLLGSMFSFRKRSSLPRLNVDTMHKQGSMVDTSSKNAEEDVTGRMSNLYSKKEKSPRLTVQKQPRETSVPHSIRVETLSGSSPPLLHSPPLQHVEVPETPQGSPVRDEQKPLTPPNTTIFPVGFDQQKIIQNSPSTPLSATSSFSHDS